MKTKKIILLIGAIFVIVSSCKNYLDPWPNGNYDSQTIWNYQNLIQGLINRCYDNIDAPGIANATRNYNDNEGVKLDGTTDDAVLSSTSEVMNKYATNSMVTSQDPFSTYWDRDYRTIAQCNMFLQDRRGYNTRYMTDPHYNDLVRKRLQGEAFALRAFFEWDLLQKFGGKGTDGNMLGFPIITKIINFTDEVNYARNTYDECVQQIISDCDSAIKYLPPAWRDFLTPAGDLLYGGGKYWNRMDGMTCKAIKANVFLTWASPRFNSGNVIARWDSAASNAKKVIDFKINVDQVASANSFRLTDPVNWSNPNSPEIVFSTTYKTGNNDIERMFYPAGFQGNGEVGATQELVNSFGMANGRPIGDPLSLYDPTKPYLNREPRFYSAIWYNTAIAKKLTGGATMYTFENWNEAPIGSLVGKDAAGTRVDNSRTNYHIKKFCYMDLNFAAASPTPSQHSKFIIRWAHMVLDFAEAANHVTGDPNVACYGLTPKAAIKYLRARKTYDGATATFNVADPYLDAQTTEAAFDALVKNERRIETCFEGMRFYDLRRWTTDADWQSVINQPVHGMYIKELTVAPATFSYDPNWQIEVRDFTSPYNPIPYNEMLRMSKLIQNEGWPSWN